MKILVVSGFLGSGKTTFIKTMSERTGRDFCVFENEYAQIDIDKALLSENANMNIWELTENCICCSGKQDFATSILTISNTIDPEYLIVEPTGIAKLSSIMNNIQRIEYERITLLKPLLILDGNNIQRMKKKFPDIFIDQIENSELILVSKCEQLESCELKSIEKQIHEINPEAEVVLEHYSTQDKNWWDMLLKRNLDGTIQVKENELEETNLLNMHLNHIQIPSMVHLISFLEMVTFGVFGEICRAKGFLNFDHDWVHFEVADGTYSITGISAKEEAKAVFIGKSINRSGIREILTPFYFEAREGKKFKKINFDKKRRL